MSVCLTITVSVFSHFQLCSSLYDDATKKKRKLNSYILSNYIFLPRQLRLDNSNTHMLIKQSFTITYEIWKYRGITLFWSRVQSFK